MFLVMVLMRSQELGSFSDLKPRYAQVNPLRTVVHEHGEDESLTVFVSISGIRLLDDASASALR